MIIFNCGFSTIFMQHKRVFLLMQSTWWTVCFVIIIIQLLITYSSIYIIFQTPNDVDKSCYKSILFQKCMCNVTRVNYWWKLHKKFTDTSSRCLQCNTQKQFRYILILIMSIFFLSLISPWKIFQCQSAEIKIEIKTKIFS